MKKTFNKFFKIFPLAVVAGFFLYSPYLAGQEMMGRSEPLDNNSQKLAQEIERDRELLEIWKDHVKTLTKERDEAYKQLEALKSQNPEAQTEIAQAPAVSPDEIQALTQERDQALRDLRSQGQGGNARLEKELKEVEADKETILREKESALAQVERLKAQLETQPHAVPAEETSSLETELENSRQGQQAMSKELQSLKALARRLEAENQRLREAATEAYELRETQKKILADKEEIIKEKETAQNEIDALKGEIQNKISEIQKLETVQQQKEAGDADKLQATNERMKSTEEELLKTRANKESIEQAYAELENRLKAQGEKTKFVESELEDARAAFSTELGELQEKNKRLSAEKRLFEKNYEELVNNTKLKDEKLSNMVLKMDQMEKENADIKNAESRRLETIQAMKKNLGANLSDIQNLKANFESYLESLVQSFDERTK